jgi:cell wall-associated protease
MTKLQRIISFSFLIVSLQANSTTIAIIDSGIDMGHEAISSYAWNNPVDIPQNNRDEDGNGYQDDFFGWNFAESNNEVIDYSYLGLLNDDIKKFFDIQAKLMIGEATDDEMTWLRDMVSNEDFIKRLSVYGNFMHGTHVARIAARKTIESKILAVKLIPTEVKLPSPVEDEKKIFSNSGLKDKLIKFSLRKLAEQQMKLLKEISEYISFHGAEVANGSFGTGYAQAKMLIKTIAETLKIELSPEEVEKYSKYFISELIDNGVDMVSVSPSTLFVFAAGNDGTDNDEYPTSPANIRARNVITVAATINYDLLAPFSNFGEKTVDLAAPGYAIESAVPGDNYLRVSGTSQAAPYVAGVAGKMAETNKKLTTSEIKKILMETVDKKDFLKGKIVSSGVVNSMRAVRAAELSAYNSIEESINMAKEEISDTPSNKKYYNINHVPVLPLPSLFQF